MGDEHGVATTANGASVGSTRKYEEVGYEGSDSGNIYRGGGYREPYDSRVGKEESGATSRGTELADEVDIFPKSVPVKVETGRRINNSTGTGHRSEKGFTYYGVGQGGRGGRGGKNGRRGIHRSPETRNRGKAMTELAHGMAHMFHDGTGIVTEDLLGLVDSRTEEEIFHTIMDNMLEQRSSGYAWVVHDFHLASKPAETLLKFPYTDVRFKVVHGMCIYNM